MKKLSEKNFSIRPFKINLNELESLIEELSEHSRTPEHGAYISIKVGLNGEKLDFDSVQEMRETTQLPNFISDFCIIVHGHSSNSRVTYFYPNESIGVRGIVTSDNGAWCAGAIDIVHRHLRLKSRWYYLIWKIHPMFLMMLGSLLIQVSVDYKPGVPNKTRDILFIISLLSTIWFGVLCFSRHKLFPSALIEVRKKDSWAKRNISEITLASFIISTVLIIINWFIE